MSAKPVAISIIVPVYNSRRDLPECLTALLASSGAEAEVIVVDDASTDGSPQCAAEMGVRVLRRNTNSGPSAARNYGVCHSRGDILLFVDSDVVIMAGAVGRVLQTLDEHPEFDAVFGSYDAQPRNRGLVSRYRNLLHHFVHQRGSPEASTFWAGCGAIRRTAFLEVGGFNEKYFPRWIEDIELGYRLREAGHRILLDKGLFGTHLKRWTIGTMIRTDVIGRAVPWTRLILESKKAPPDLNIKAKHRLSVALVGLTCLFILLSPLRLELLGLSILPLGGVIVLNRDLYTFFFRQGGFVFAAGCIPLHLLYYLYSGLAFLYCWVEFQLKRPVSADTKPNGALRSNQSRSSSL